MIDLNDSDTERLLRTTAREVLVGWVERDSSDVPSAADLWQEIISLGWAGLAVPGACGSGGSLLELGILLEELGRAATPTPLFQAAAVGSLVAREGLTDEGKELLRSVATGGTTVALIASNEATANLTEVDGSSGRKLIGGPYLVEWASEADRLVVPYRVDSGIGLASFAPRVEGVSVERVDAIDDEPVGRVVLLRVPLAAGVPLTNSPLSSRDWLEARARIALLRAAEMVGGASRVLELTVEHGAKRWQFGRPLGSFQAVQHMCADMAIKLDGARFAVYEGLWLAETRRTCRAAAAVAAYFAGETYEYVTRTAAQLHGGMGYTTEYPLQRYFRHAKAQRLRQGAVRTQLMAIADLLPYTTERPVPSHGSRSLVTGANEIADNALNESVRGTALS